MSARVRNRRVDNRPKSAGLFSREQRPPSWCERDHRPVIDPHTTIRAVELRVRPPGDLDRRAEIVNDAEMIETR